MPVAELDVVGVQSPRVEEIHEERGAESLEAGVEDEPSTVVACRNLDFVRHVHRQRSGRVEQQTRVPVGQLEVVIDVYAEEVLRADEQKWRPSRLECISY